MNRSSRVSALNYLAALACLCAALVLRWLLTPVLGDKLPLIMVFGAVVASVWIGGYRPALLVAILGYVASVYLFMRPPWQLDLSQPFTLTALILYVLIISMVIYFGEVLRRAKERYQLGEQAAREQAELISTTLASIADAVITTAPDSRITTMNPVAEALTGWAKEEAIGWPLTQVFRIVDDATRVEVDSLALLADKDMAVAESHRPTVLIARDGTERSIDYSAAPIRRNDHDIVGAVLVFRDISERQRVEAERRNSQREIAKTLESVTDGFVLYDRDWRIVHVNAEAEKLNKLSRAEMLGQIFWELFPAVIGTKLEYEYRRAMTDRVTVEFENHYQPFGRWYSIKGFPTADGGLTTFIRDITDRKCAEDILRQSEARFRAGIEAVSSIVWTNDPQGMMVGEQSSWAKFTGQDIESYQGHGWARAVHPDDVEPTIDAWRDAVDGKKIFVFEHRVLRHDGEWRLCSVRAVPVFNDRGEITEWVGVHTDITESKRAEQEVVRLASESSRQQRLYETVLTNTPDFMYVFSLDHKVLYANEALIKMWGRGREGAIGKTFLEIGYEPWHAEMHDREIDQVRATRKPIRGEVPFNGTNGRRQYDYIFVPIFGADGEVEAVAGTTRDVTERKDNEERLRASEERRRLALDAAEMGAFNIDPVAKTLTSDERFRMIYAGSADAMDYEQAFAAVYPDDRQRIRDAVIAATRTDHPAPYAEEYRVVHQDGSIRWVFARGRANYARDGSHRLISFDGTVADITARKLIEQEREQLVLQLRDQDRRKDEFLATLAHELRNPLAPIRNGLEVMRLVGANGTIEKARSMMDRQVTQLVRLVDDLLDVSRVTSGKLELRRERVEIKAVIEAAVETTRPVFEQAGHALDIVLPDEPILVDGDATRLAQVVANLLNNSAKYTQRGGYVRLVVSHDDGMAILVVADNGIGIPPTMLATVFEMFAQVDRALEKTTGGLGIGLSLVKGLVEMHGGTIEARSEGEGSGSEFIVRLPAASSAIQKVEQAPNNEPLSATARRVLVADDNLDSAESLAQLLELLGNNVSTANDGLQAVSVAEAMRPDIILLDIGMPKLNGHEACRRIREQPWSENATIIAMTGWGQDEDKRLSREAGFDYHLVKPVDPVALEKLLGSL